MRLLASFVIVQTYLLARLWAFQVKGSFHQLPPSTVLTAGEDISKTRLLLKPFWNGAELVDDATHGVRVEVDDTGNQHFVGEAHHDSSPTSPSPSRSPSVERSFRERVKSDRDKRRAEQKQAIIQMINDLTSDLEEECEEAVVKLDEKSLEVDRLQKDIAHLQSELQHRISLEDIAKNEAQKLDKNVRYKLKLLKQVNSELRTEIIEQQGEIHNLRRELSAQEAAHKEERIESFNHEEKNGHTTQAEPFKTQHERYSFETQHEIVDAQIVEDYEEQVATEGTATVNEAATDDRQLDAKKGGGDAQTKGIHDYDYYDQLANEWAATNRETDASGADGEEKHSTAPAPSQLDSRQEVFDAQTKEVDNNYDQLANEWATMNREIDASGADNEDQRQAQTGEVHNYDQLAKEWAAMNG